MTIQVISPIQYAQWDDFLLTIAGTTFFHTSAWARVLAESYGYKPLYFTAMDQGRIVGLIPVMEIDSFLTGKRGVSLPFTDMCEPVADTIDTFQALMRHLTEYGNQAGWDSLELRGGGEFLAGAAPCADHFIHTLELGGDENCVKKKFRDSTRRNIRKSQKEGVGVSLHHTLGAIETFYKLHCRTRRRHGIPPQPWSFFRKVHEHIISAGNGFVALAKYRDRTIAGAVYSIYRDQAIYKYGASEQSSQHLRPSNLLMWEAIRWCCRNWVRTFSFGRTESHNKGLLQFKRGWGATEERFNYYLYDFKRKGFNSCKKGPNTTYNLFRILPIPILRLTGRLLYRHVG